MNCRPPLFQAAFERCIEVTLKYFQFHRLINRGFLTGPWLPIYGSGATLITVVIKGLAPLEFSVGTTCGVVPSVRLPGIYDELCTGETLPCPLVGLQPEAHESSWKSLDWEPDTLRAGRRGDCGSDQSAVASSF